MFDIDLGAFELVDSGVTAESLLSQDDPVIFHEAMPVHSVHHDTVQTEAALENLMSAPASMLSTEVPPTMVADNYCFVVDGDQARMGDIMGDDQWWRHTSRPTKYFYSDDLKKFYRVSVITAKGNIISARLTADQTFHRRGSMGPEAMSAPPPHTETAMSEYAHPPENKVHQALSAEAPVANSLPPSLMATPRPSVISMTPRESIFVPPATKGHRGEKVPLMNVYKVIRFYSFWKTCTSFHRIVTMIDKVKPEDRSGGVFKKRLFVQYLWRNAKPYEKARVQKEFDPRRQRLLRFVADSGGKEKVKKMHQQSSAPAPSARPTWRRQASVMSAASMGDRRPLSRTSTAASDDSRLSSGNYHSRRNLGPASSSRRSPF